MAGVDIEVRGAVMNFEAEGAPAVVGVDLKVESGSRHGIVGESASGKTTLVRAILGRIRLKAGSVRIGEFDIPVSGAKERREFSRIVGWIPQDAIGSLDPLLPVWNSVSEGLRIHTGMGRAYAKISAGRLLQQVELSEYHLDRLPGTLSGGQCQRACIARAIAMEPRLIIADEPLSALDPIVQCQILDLLRGIVEGTGVTFVMVSHSIGSVRAFCDYVTVMYRGRVVETGQVEEVFTDPQYSHTRELLEAERSGWA